MRKRAAFRLGALNCSFDKINSENLISELSQINCEVARATTEIQNRICGGVLFNKRSHCGLRRVDLPGCTILVYGIEKSKWIRTKSTQTKSPFGCLLTNICLPAQNPDNTIVNGIRYDHLGSTLCIEKLNHRGSTGRIHKLNYDRINVFVIACDAVVSW